MSRRLAVFGTFDVENYGDLLFPLVAQACLADAGVEVVPVSPTDSAVGYADSHRPLSFAEFARDPMRFDGVLIGGGNIVHLRDFGLPAYPSTAYAALWLGATAHAVAHGLPVCWNAPGVLAPRDPGPPPPWLARATAAADHFAVRDVPSADAMGRWSGRRPEVLPDPALDLARLWPRDTLIARAGVLWGELGLDDGGPVIALHVKRRSLRDQPLAEFAAALDGALAATGARAVLLALGRCHDDHTLVQELHALAPARTVAFDQTDRLRDIAAVIAGATAYVGASLHGHITAAAFGTPARVVAVPALHKFAGQARTMGRSDDLAADWAAALEALPAVLAEDRRPLPAEVGTQLSGHWARIAGLVRDGRTGPDRPAVFRRPNIARALQRVVDEANAALAPAGR